MKQKAIIIAIIAITIIAGAAGYLFLGQNTVETVDKAGFIDNAIEEIKQVFTPEKVPEKDIKDTTSSVSGSGTQYLTIQLLTYSALLAGETVAAEYDVPAPFDKKGIEEIIDKKVKDIGLAGDGKTRQLGFIIGPMTLNHTDEQLRVQIRSMFEIAEAKNIAVGFHIDDSMFWQNRGLAKDKNNIEWLDWQGTPNTGRHLSWGQEAKIAPQMCFNSKAVTAEVSRVAKDVIGTEIKKGVDKLKASGKEHLFAGVIAGWETQIGPDLATRKPLGYCALTNKGFSAKNLPKDIDREREIIVQEFIELWTKSLMDAGISKEKIYSHIGATPATLYNLLKTQGALFSYSEFVRFAPPAVAFGKYHNPGFSVYGKIGQEFYEVIQKNGSPSWAMAEGISGNPLSDDPKEQGGWEGWLESFFNHGATLVNVFPVGIDSTEATAAFKKFLRGEKLIENSEEKQGSVSEPQDNNMPSAAEKDIPACFAKCIEAGSAKPEDCMEKCS